MDTQPLTIKLTIQSTLAHIPLMSVAVRELCSLTSLDVADHQKVELSVVEALTNVVKHAYQGSQDYWIRTFVHLFKNRMIIEIHDTGVPREQELTSELSFDPDDISSLPTGGMGLYIIQQVMDEVQSFRDGDENVLILTRYFDVDEQS